MLLDTGKGKMLTGQLEIAGALQRDVYFYILNGGAKDMLFRMKPDGATPYEAVWDYDKERGIILGLDLEQGWLYYGKHQTLAIANSIALGRYALRSWRCHLDGSDRQEFCDRTAFDPVTIGQYIYFSSADQDFANVSLRRYNTQAGIIEDLAYGLLQGDLGAGA